LWQVNIVYNNSEFLSITTDEEQASWIRDCWLASPRRIWFRPGEGEFTSYALNLEQISQITFMYLGPKEKNGTEG
jgi:hypothetical protein